MGVITNKVKDLVLGDGISKVKKIVIIILIIIIVYLLFKYMFFNKKS